MSLVATLSGPSLESFCDLYKREAYCEYSFGFIFFPSGMATHSYATQLAGLTGRFGLSLPEADQRLAAALREAPPNSGNDLTTQLTQTLMGSATGWLALLGSARPGSRK